MIAVLTLNLKTLKLKIHHLRAFQTCQWALVGMLHTHIIVEVIRKLIGRGNPSLSLCHKMKDDSNLY